MVELILHWLGLGAVILLVARTLPGVYVYSFGTSIIV
ncbi:MAG: hypothetical protein ACI8Z1_000746, partial [Candidatus Azotimanducaceae bacterium]